jgi:hypothetical protein
MLSIAAPAGVVGATVRDARARGPGQARREGAASEAPNEPAGTDTRSEGGAAVVRLEGSTVTVRAESGSCMIEWTWV